MTITTTNPDDFIKVLNILREFPSIEIKLNKAERKMLDNRDSAEKTASTGYSQSEKTAYTKRLRESIENIEKGNYISFQTMDELKVYFGL